MKNKFRDLFTFSSGERKGIIVLAAALILVCGYRMLNVFHRPAPLPDGYPQWMKDTGIFGEANAETFFSSDSFSEVLPGYVNNQNDEIVVDPNSAILEELLRAGFSLQLSRTIIKYRNKGGKFAKTEDLKKIHGMTPEIYSSLSKTIRINQAETKTYADKPDKRLNINLADTTMFEGLPGIGPVLARRIIKYRKLLGGYYSPVQIKEVYGISDSLYRQIAERLEGDTVNIIKIKLNSANEMDIARHPYIGKYCARGIIRYREQATRITNVDELRANGLISKDQSDKLKYYLSP